MIWNPDKIIFALGPLQIRYYNLLWIIAFVVGWYLMKKIFQKEKIALEKLDSLFIHAVLATMLGARLGHVFFYDWPHYSDHLIEILLPIRESANEMLFGFIKGYEFTGFTGLASHGAAIGVIIGMYLFHRKFKDLKMLWILDRVVIPVAIGAFFIRLGNFFNSEINGKIVEKTHPFAVKFLQDEISERRAIAITKEKVAYKAYELIEKNPKFSEFLDAVPYRHPAQLYEGIAYIFVFLALWFLYWKTEYKNKPGFLFGLFLVLLWTVRFFVEFMKRSQGGFESALDNFIKLSTGQWLSIPFIILGFYFMFKNKKTVA